MQWIESRLHALERRVEDLYRRLLDLINQLNGVRQGLANAFASTSPDSGSGSSGFYVCMAPASGTYAGTWSGSAPTAGSSFTATVYQVSGTGTISSLGTQTVVNWLPATLQNSKACVVIPDGTGDYGVVSQSCT